MASMKKKGGKKSATRKRRSRGLAADANAGRAVPDASAPAVPRPRGHRGWGPTHAGRRSRG